MTQEEAKQEEEDKEETQDKEESVIQTLDELLLSLRFAPLSKAYARGQPSETWKQPPRCGT